MITLYIYYKVDPAQAHTLRDAVQGQQQRLRAAMPGLVASLHERLADRPGDAPPDALTWMETYAFNGHADDRAWQQLDEALEAAVQQLPTTAIHGARHVERFRRLSVAHF